MVLLNASKRNMACVELVTTITEADSEGKKVVLLNDRDYRYIVSMYKDRIIRMDIKIRYSPQIERGSLEVY